MENSDIVSFRKCCSWWFSHQVVPSQPAFIPGPSQASACVQISLFEIEVKNLEINAVGIPSDPKNVMFALNSKRWQG